MRLITNKLNSLDSEGDNNVYFDSDNSFSMPFVDGKTTSEDDDDDDKTTSKDDDEEDDNNNENKTNN